MIIISLLLAATLTVSQGTVDYSVPGGVGKYEKTTSYVLTEEIKPATTKTSVKSTGFPTAIKPKRVIRVPVKQEDLTPSFTRE